MSAAGMFLAGLMLAQAGQAAAPATPPAPAQDATELSDVIVRGRPLDARVNSFISNVLEAPASQGPARWRDNFCVGVANLQRDTAQYMVDRISDVAASINLNPGEPGCTPNVLIIGTTDGAGLAKGLVEAKPRTFWPGGSGMTRPRSALEAFKTSDAAVRWWHVAVPVDADTGTIAVRLPGEEPPQITRMPGRLRTEIRNDIGRVIIIVDLAKAEGMNFNQLSDYVAMVALSQIDPDADASDFDSVLNLFKFPETTPGLSEWDRAYLTALYSAELNQASAAAQRGAVARIMTRDRRNDAQSAPEGSVEP